ncbi:CapA family protein [Paenibacillus alvei]|uniref:CapA family protein n=1 Tax=Paenibacillus alvei TaxID=44250 RepID=UPI003D2AED35
MNSFHESRKDRYARKKKQRLRKIKMIAGIGLLISVGLVCMLILTMAMRAVDNQSEMVTLLNPDVAPVAPLEPNQKYDRGGEKKSNKDTVKMSSSQDAIRIIFAGDALMDWSVKETIRKKGPDYPFEYVKDEVSSADYAVVNLETAITHHTEKDTNQLYNFKSDPESLQGLKNAGFNLVTIANNHTLDFKQKGFLDTLKYLEKYDIPYIGGGRNKEEAYRAHTVKMKGKTIKFLAFSRFIPQTYWFAGKDRPGIAEAYNKSSVLPVIKKEREDCDYLLVYLHWGVEKNLRPEPWQRNYAREMIDAGADAIIGSHVHVLQGFEFYKGKPIAYSIGNFLFPDYVRGDKADTGLLNLTLDQGNIEMSFTPYFIYKDQIIKKGEAYDKKQLKYLESISIGVKIDGKQVRDAVKANGSATAPPTR